MARKRTPTPDWKQPLLKGKTVCVAGALVSMSKDTLAEAVEREKATLVAKVSESLDILVISTSPSKTALATKKRAERLIGKGADITILDEVAFAQMFQPSPEDTLDMLRAGEAGWKRWRELCAMPWVRSNKIDLRGRDLRDFVLKGPDRWNQIDLQAISFDGADLRGSTITNANIREVKGARFDGANLRGTSVYHCEDCSFENVDLSGGYAGYSERCIFDGARFDSEARFSGHMRQCSCKGIQLIGTRLNPADLSGSDFTNAKMPVETASYTCARDTVFVEADLSGADLDQSKFDRSDFRGANLNNARLEKSVFTKANLSGANLSGADLRKANLGKADLTNADFTKSNLANADLRGAKIDGADFEGTNLVGAKLTGLDLSKAKNLDPNRLAAPKVGPSIKKLASIAKKCKRFSANAELDVDGMRVSVNVQGWRSGKNFYAGGGFTEYPKPNHSASRQVDGNSIGSAMLELAALWHRGTLKVDSITIDVEKCPVPKEEVLRIATRAWCEAFGIEPPKEEEFDEKERAKSERLDKLQAEAPLELHGGPKGVKKWNARPREERQQVCSLRKQDFTGKNLKGANLSYLDLQRSIFDQANLQKVTLTSSQLQHCSFVEADLTKVVCASASLNEADFTRATLVGAKARNSRYRRATFADANLTEADFSYSDVSGADFSTANLTDTTWQRTIFDEKTTFPAGFTIPDEMTWKGEGSDPRIEAKIRALPEVRTLTFADFMTRLAEDVEKPRLDKALAMLKAERFSLYSKTTADSLVGVVKSQTSKELVYSCRLTQGGHFACCTQNLKPCGGLKGALCKHLLVLLVGLSKTGDLDPAKLYHWIQASRFRKPEFDADSLSEALLEYKGAESGEIDWRPTETIPEDFYVL